MQVIPTEMRAKLGWDEGGREQREVTAVERKVAEFAAALKHFNWLAALTAIAAHSGFK